MNIVDVVNIIYPGQIQAGNIAFGQDENSPIFITKWDIPNTPQPTIAELEAKIPELQRQFEYESFVSNGIPLISFYCDNVAKEKQFDSALSCASYVNSTIETWSSQAIAFVAWRDAVYSYAIIQEQLMKIGQRSIPTFDEFKAELPVIAWP